MIYIQHIANDPHTPHICSKADLLIIDHLWCDKFWRPKHDFHIFLAVVFPCKPEVYQLHLVRLGSNDWKMCRILFSKLYHWRLQDPCIQDSIVVHYSRVSSCNAIFRQPGLLYFFFMKNYMLTLCAHYSPITFFLKNNNIITRNRILYY